jgi:hypothetical protein
MKAETIKEFRKQYPFLWSPVIETLPDWYFGPIKALFEGVTSLDAGSSFPIGAVALNFRYVAGVVAVSVSPVKPICEWTTEEAMLLLIHVDAFNRTSSERCQICGKPSVGLFKSIMGGQADRFLCEDHGSAFLGRPVAGSLHDAVE